MKHLGRNHIFVEFMLLFGISAVCAALVGIFWSRSVLPDLNDRDLVLTMVQSSTPGPLANRSAADFVAPDFTLTTLNGELLTLSELRGYPVILNFWASWCAPCRDEMLLLNRASEQFSDRGLRIVGVNVTAKDTVANARAFADQFAIGYPIVFDDVGIVSFGRYSVLGLPTSVFVDADGMIRRVVFGEISQDALDTYITEIVDSDTR